MSGRNVGSRRKLKKDGNSARGRRKREEMAKEIGKVSRQRGRREEEKWREE